MLSTWLTDRFDLSVPVVCAPMAGVAGGDLVAAVGAAGGLGMIGFAQGSADDLHREAARARAPGKPFGIGLLAWILERRPELVDAAIEAQPALLSVSFGGYGSAIERAKRAGILTTTQVATVAEAREAEAAGVDVIVARGLEGGGHGRDAVATLPLLQGVLDAVGVPVLAAGGIAGPRGLAAVLAAGAAGAWVGTAFTVAAEAANDPARRKAVIDATEVDTIYTTVLDIGRGAPWPPQYGGRAVRSAYSDKWHGRAAELVAAPEPLDDIPAWAGQGAGIVNAERPAAEILADFARAEDLLRGPFSR